MDYYSKLGGLFEAMKDYSLEEVEKEALIVRKFTRIFDAMEKTKIVSEKYFKNITEQHIHYINSPFFDTLYDFLFFKNIKRKRRPYYTNFMPLEYLFSNDKFWVNWLKDKKVEIYRQLSCEDVIFSTYGISVHCFQGNNCDINLYYVETEKDIENMVRRAKYDCGLYKEKKKPHDISVSNFSNKFWCTVWCDNFLNPKKWYGITVDGLLNDIHDIQYVWYETSTEEKCNCAEKIDMEKDKIFENSRTCFPLCEK